MKSVGAQAYKLDLPEHLKVHNVFHVNLLKQYIPRTDHVLKDDQVVMPIQGILRLQPSRILETRERSLRNRVIRDHLVQWKDYPIEDATWEEEASLLKEYPELFAR